MTNRREIMQLGLATAALPFASVWAFQAGKAPAASGGTLPLFRVVTDTRFADSRAFGAEASHKGLSIAAMPDGDITDFWYQQLDTVWRHAPVAIAGLTSHAPLFLLEQLGWDRGLRVVFRAEHRSARGGVEHTITGPAVAVAGMDAPALQGAAWSAAMARAALQLPVASAGHATQSHFAPRAAMPVDEDCLYTWVIAPVA